MMWSKYKAKKTTIDGLTFDSKAEANRYLYLRDSQKRGDIRNLRLQVKYVLIPAQYEEEREGKKAGKIKRRLLEREVSYRSDFEYDDMNGNHIVEDVKGMKTKEYILKRKMMLYFFGIRITEV